MNADNASHQRIARLSPLGDAFAAIAAIKPVAAREIDLADAQGCVLAHDVVIAGALPPGPVALSDGWAVDSEATRDAGPYTPLMLPAPPERVDAFAALPSGTDAVAPLDAVMESGGAMQVIAPVAPGEGVLPAGGDTERGAVLYRAGMQLRAVDLAVLAAAGIARIRIRQPHIRLVNTRPGDAVLDSAVAFMARVILGSGARADISSNLEEALHSEAADAIVAIGGTGAGRDDRSVISLARMGRVTCHGLGLSPGETSALGTVDGRVVLLIPGRIDAVLACWLVLGRALVEQLSGAEQRAVAIKATLGRKLTSRIGLAEVVLFARNGDHVEPLASGFLSLQSLARADGWVLVPAESEGYPAGSFVDMRPLP